MVKVCGVAMAMLPGQYRGAGLAERSLASAIQRDLGLSVS
jgi:hypothetical protein